MEKCLISIIVPVFNVNEIYLEECINSIQKQSYANIEILLIDDGSTNQCGRICDLYAEKDKRIKVIHKQNGGVSSARNYGLENSSGDYVMFVDSDDILEKNIVNYLAFTAEETKAGITVCSCYHMSGDSNRESNEVVATKTVLPENGIDYLAYNKSIFDELEPTAVWGKLYKRAVIENIKFNESMILGEDFIFNYYAINNTNFVTYSNQKLYNYRILETGIMHRKQDTAKIMKTFSELHKFYETQKDSKYRDALIGRCVNIAFTLYLKLSASEKSECNEIENFIRTNQKKVIKNPKVNKKVKIALVLSMIDFRLMRKIFDFVC